MTFILEDSDDANSTKISYPYLLEKVSINFVEYSLSKFTS